MPSKATGSLNAIEAVLMSDVQAAQLLADFLRDNQEDIIIALISAYERNYTFSASVRLPDDVKCSWSRQGMRDFAQDLVGEPDPTRYKRANAGDIVIQREPSVSALFMFIETQLFYCRTIAPLIWQHFLNEPEVANQLIDVLDERVRTIVAANMKHFLDEAGTAGFFSQSWNLCPPSPQDNASARASVARPDEEASLTARERDMLELSCQGLTNKEIAARLGIGLSTVKGYMGKLFEKFGVRSRSELIALVVRREKSV